MAEFINTIDVLGDDVVIDSIINRTIAEFKDNVVTKIGDYGFAGCSNLSDVILPNVSSIGEYAFLNCTSLEAVDFPLVTSMRGYNFENCTKLKDVNLPAVNSMSYYVFSGCQALMSLNLPSLTSVMFNVFGNMTIDHLKLPKLTYSHSYVFRDSTFQTIDIGSSCDFRGSSFFGCKAKALILRSEVISKATDNITINGYDLGFYIYVPASLIEEYKVATNWSIHADKFRVLEDYTVDGTITGELDETKI